MRDDWVETSYKDLVHKISTSKNKLKQKEYLTQGLYPVIDQGKALIGGYSNDQSKLFDCESPLIIFGDHTKCVKLVRFPFIPGADGTKVLQPKKFILPTFLSYLTPILVFKIRDKGYARHYQHIEKQNFPLPPLSEQRAIVAKIEQLFSELDNGIANLKAAQDKLDIYRQAVLKKAFEGELTKEWREQQTDLPTADELLQQIKQERQRHYAQQLADWEQAVEVWEAGGRVGKKPSKPKIANEVTTLNEEQLSKLFNIPEHYIWIKIGNITLNTEYGSSNKSQKKGLIPVLRMGNIQNGRFDWTDLAFSNNESEIEQYILHFDDVLFNRTNSPELVGKTAVYKNEKPAIFAGYLIRVNQVRSLCNADYINYYLNSHPAKVHGNSVKTDGVNQSNINGEKLKNYPFPYCPLKEQTQIVQEIESRLSVCDNLAATIQQSLQQAEALRQSILKKAFEGRLLSAAELDACRAEADWEPAAQLLARIQQENK